MPKSHHSVLLHLSSVLSEVTLQCQLYLFFSFSVAGRGRLTVGGLSTCCMDDFLTVLIIDFCPLGAIIIHWYIVTFLKRLMCLTVAYLDTWQFSMKCVYTYINIALTQAYIWCSRVSLCLGKIYSTDPDHILKSDSTGIIVSAPVFQTLLNIVYLLHHCAVHVRVKIQKSIIWLQAFLQMTNRDVFFFRLFLSHSQNVCCQWYFAFFKLWRY